MKPIRQNLDEVKALIDKAAQKSGRSAADITIVAVTKGVSVERMIEARQAGLVCLGENRLQEAEEKIPAVDVAVPDTKWHMIGHLQRNKIKAALEKFSVIQSLDSVRLAEDLAAAAAAAGKKVEALLEVNISGQAQRFGFSPEEIYSAVDDVAKLDALQITGLMGIAPHPATEADCRAAFSKLRNLYSVCKGLKGPNIQMRYLSMGMSEDFEIAVEEGSNMVRLGRRLFQ